MDWGTSLSNSIEERSILRQKRIMPRQARLDVPSALHLVMIRGIERRAIFKTDKDRKDFLDRIGSLLPVLGMRPEGRIQPRRKAIHWQSEDCIVQFKDVPYGTYSGFQCYEIEWKGGNVMPRSLVLFVCVLLLTGCASDRILVKKLDATIIEAAEKAKAAGAKEVTVEVSLVSGFEGGATIPIPVVPVDAKASLNHSTKITATVDLEKWLPPKAFTRTDNYFILDTNTYELRKPGMK
jgi:hypothetical protein